MNSYKQQNQLIRSRRGFTLIELVMVMAVMGVLMALTIPSVVSVTASRDINKAVNTAQDVASMARQQALTRGTMVALLLSPASAATLSNPQQFVLLQANTDVSGNVTWAASSPWIKLPADIALSPLSRTQNGSPASSFYTIPSSGPIPVKNLPQTLGSQSLINFSYIVFYSDGSVLSNTPGPAISLQKVTTSGTNPDYMVLIPEASGRARITAMK